MRSLLACAVALALAGAHAHGDVTGVVGRVRAPDGRPVAAATVSLLASVPETGPPVRSVSTDAHGWFSLGELPPGRQALEITAQGFASERIRLDVPRTGSMRLPAIRLAPLTFVRVRPMTAEGLPVRTPRVLHRSFPVPGEPPQVGPRDWNTIVDERDGSLTLGPLPRGMAVLGLESPPFARTRLPDVRVDGSTPVVDLGSVVVRRGAQLHVRVVDGAGTPLSGVQLSLDDGEAVSPFGPLRAYTDRDGGARFDELPGGAHRLWVGGDPPCRPGRPGVARSVQVPDEGLRREVVVLQSSALTVDVTHASMSLSGMAVAIEPIAPPVTSPDWRPVPLGSSPPRSPGDRLVACRGTLGQNGRATITDLPPGPAWVRVQLPTGTWSARVSVEPGARATSLVVSDGATAIRVVDERTGEPIERAHVMWEEGGARVEAETTATGDVLLEGVSPAAGTLTLRRDGYRPHERRLSGLDAGPLEIRLARTPRPAVKCEIVDEDGRPVRDAVVLIDPLDGAEKQLAVTDARGLVRFRMTSRVPVRVTALAPGHRETTVTGVPGATDETVAKIVLPPERSRSDESGLSSGRR